MNGDGRNDLVTSMAPDYGMSWMRTAAEGNGRRLDRKAGTKLIEESIRVNVWTFFTADTDRSILYVP